MSRARSPRWWAVIDADFLLRLCLLRDRFPGLANQVKRRFEVHGDGGQALRQALHARQDGRDERRALARCALRDMPPDRLREQARARGLGVLFRGGSNYPAALLDLEDPPPVLFLIGSLPAPGSAATAVVGSRKATEAGRRAAHTLAASLAIQGEAIISGMAFGIDDAAHRGALSVSGRTMAVLASGADLPSPQAQARLHARITAAGGAVVSEYPPGSSARPYRFPLRNRLIAALAQRILVVEARQGSGALHTVDHGLALGRTVLAYPGDGLSAACRGSNQLIREGAELVLGPEDLLGPPEQCLFPAAAPLLCQGSEKQSAVLAHALAHGPLALDELALRVAVEIGALRGAVARLERAGLVDFRGGVVQWRYPRRPDSADSASLGCPA